MISIKIQCGCGQNYVFDVEPAEGRMPFTVACPACGADGTAAAEAFISQSAPVPEPALAAASGGLQLHSSAPVEEAPPAARTPRRRMGQLSPDQARHEARAKILWGDPPPQVMGFLMSNGFTVPEAKAAVDQLFQERARTIRANGIRNVCVGAGLMIIPVAGWFYFQSARILPVRLFAFMVMAGLYGVWLFAKGVSMVLAPKTLTGDASE